MSGFEIATALAARGEDLVSALSQVWEASVRATHAFLTEDDIVALRPEVRAGLAGVAVLDVARASDGGLIGFSGVQDGKLEMLFVAPQARGCGVGKALLERAVREHGATSLDVNEQNPQAVGFYRHEGFAIVDRAPVDDAGRPFPLLRMKLVSLAREGDKDIREQMASGRWFDASDASLARDRAHAKRVMQRFNTDASLDDETRMDLLRGLFGQVGEGSLVSPGAQVDYGFNVFLGKGAFVNFNGTFLDGAPIVFGDRTMVGPGCTFATPLHPLVARERTVRSGADGAARMPERNLPIRVGNDVWLASNVTVNPGVTIGDGAVVGSGSVVTRDVPPRTIAFGNPCRVVREITDADSVADALAELGLA